MWQCVFAIRMWIPKESQTDLKRWAQQMLKKRPQWCAYLALGNCMLMNSEQVAYRFDKQRQPERAEWMMTMYKPMTNSSDLKMLDFFVDVHDFYLNFLKMLPHFIGGKPFRYYVVATKVPTSNSIMKFNQWGRYYEVALQKFELLGSYLGTIIRQYKLLGSYLLGTYPGT